MPGGELVTGAPEDVVLSGGIARRSRAGRSAFTPEERSFRWLTGDRGTAAVRGDGLRAAMARAVLEREGYAVAADAGDRGRACRVDDVRAGRRCRSRRRSTSAATTSRRWRRSCASRHDEKETDHEKHQHDAGRRRRNRAWPAACASPRRSPRVETYGTDRRVELDRSGSRDRSARTPRSPRSPRACSRICSRSARRWRRRPRARSRRS